MAAVSKGKLKFREMESWAGFITSDEQLFLMCPSTPYFSQQSVGSNGRTHVGFVLVPPGLRNHVDHVEWDEGVHQLPLPV